MLERLLLEDEKSMSLADTILELRKPLFWDRFQLLQHRPVPVLPKQPRTIAEALRIGYLLGLQDGYGEGLVGGVELGMDIGSALASAETESWVSWTDLN